jgi:hypothetical protein
VKKWGTLEDILEESGFPKGNDWMETRGHLAEENRVFAE